MAKEVTIVSAEGDEFRLPVEQAVRMLVIKNMLEDLDEEQAVHPIPLPNAHTGPLRKAIAYVQHYAAEPPASDDKKTDDMSAWDAEFIRMPQSDLFELILTANYLDVKALLDLCCKAVADLMRGRTPEEIRKIFNIKNDFMPEEETQVRKENEWVE